MCTYRIIVPTSVHLQNYCISVYSIDLVNVHLLEIASSIACVTISPCCLLWSRKHIFFAYAIISQNQGKKLHWHATSTPLSHHSWPLPSAHLSAYIFWKSIYERWHKVSNNVVCASSKGSDQPVHTGRLLRAFAFASSLNILWLFSYWQNIIWSF